MKKIVLILAALIVLFSCQKKKDNPTPEPVVVQQKVVATPQPKWKKMRTGERNANYLIQFLEYTKTENDKDIYSLKGYSNKHLILDTTVTVWWENNEPKSNYFVFKNDNGWIYNYEKIQNFWMLY